MSEFGYLVLSNCEQSYTGNLILSLRKLNDIVDGCGYKWTAARDYINRLGVWILV